MDLIRIVTFLISSVQKSIGQLDLSLLDMMKRELLKELGTSLRLLRIDQRMES
jgi:hypothetical protein